MTKRNRDGLSRTEIVVAREVKLATAGQAAIISDLAGNLRAVFYALENLASGPLGDIWHGSMMRGECIRSLTRVGVKLEPPVMQQLSEEERDGL